MKIRKHVLSFYLFGPIEFASKPDGGWRKLIASMFESHLAKKLDTTFIWIDPVEESFRIGKSIKDNVVYATKVKTAGRWKKFKEFMNNVWEQDKKNVDRSDILIAWVTSPEELQSLCRSVGSIREIHRAIDQGKPIWLICTAPLASASSHFLHLILTHGKIFGSIYEAMEYLEKHHPRHAKRGAGKQKDR